MTLLKAAAQFLSDNLWLITGVALTIGYGAVLTLMIRKVIRDRALPESEKPGPQPLFYLGQAYLAFVWPIPLFLVLEALDQLQ